MTEIIPGIYQLRVAIPVSPLAYVNAYLVKGDKGHLLVDTGWNSDDSFDSLKKQLVEIGVKREDISQIVVTHVHPDHYGLAGGLRQLSRGTLALHHLEKGFIESRYVNPDKLLKQIADYLSANGTPADELSYLPTASMKLKKFVIPSSPDINLRGGEIIASGDFRFQVIWTPGHSRGHISLYEPKQKILLSGDHILPHITPNISCHPQSSANPLGDYLASLDEIRKLDIALVLPGHEHTFSNTNQRIDEIIRHHRQRNTQILKSIKDEPKTAYQIATSVIWKQDDGGLIWNRLSPWDKRMAITETLAHLEAMRHQRKVSKSVRDGVIYYQAK